uniref:Putative tetrapyrrole biosynthesis, uroporphyrinogen III synthase n=1 Tax=Helianthus annuus TaxID=4232 RepID=A0A251SB16_HELAN
MVYLVDLRSNTVPYWSLSVRLRVLSPRISTPAGLVEELGLGGGRRVLCPVPVVVELEEPPVVPNFIQDLSSNGWVAMRVDAYETQWMGVECAKAMVQRDNGGVVDAVVFTSTGEVEGMLKSLRAMGVYWGKVVERNPGVVVAAHGPVTAAGVERLGVRVDVVSRKFGSFEGVVDALDEFWND